MRGHWWVVLLSWCVVPVTGCSGTAGDQGLEMGLEWIRVTGGGFQQGNPIPSEDVTDELPVRTVDLPTFDMLKTEVTVAQYGACVYAKWCSEPEKRGDGSWGEHPGSLGYDLDETGRPVPLGHTFKQRGVHFSQRQHS